MIAYHFGNCSSLDFSQQFCKRLTRCRLKERILIARLHLHSVFSSCRACRMLQRSSKHVARFTPQNTWTVIPNMAGVFRSWYYVNPRRSKNKIFINQNAFLKHWLLQEKEQLQFRVTLRQTCLYNSASALEFFVCQHRR